MQDATKISVHILIFFMKILKITNISQYNTIEMPPQETQAKNKIFEN